MSIGTINHLYQVKGRNFHALNVVVLASERFPAQLTHWHYFDDPITSPGHDSSSSFCISLLSMANAGQIWPPNLLPGQLVV